ncbi:AsmA family protein [Acidimangrovimonas pyrenivorans]|uniref:AsmA family protein n=1 Tax=Acidimangrovimonas pyrenivorans TaxID=2030798 RepID=A0ABV7ABC1_9RHOB
MRWLLRLLGLIVVLALLAGGALMLLPSDRIARLAAGQFEAATGRAMEITGSVRPTLWPRLGVRTGPVQIANAAWSKQGPMLQAKGLEIGVDLGALIGGDIRISKVEVLAPKIVLERRKDGTGNWEFSPPATAKAPAADTAPAGKSGGVRAFSLDKGIISDGSVLWIDHATGQRIALDKIDATLAIPAFTGPADLQLTALANKRKMTIAGKLDAFADFLAGKVVGSDLTATIGGSTIRFAGKLGTAPVAAQGDLDMTLVDPAALVAILGAAAPDLPRGLGHDKIVAKGQVTLAPDGGLHLRNGAVTLDGNSMNVAADVTFPAARPKINARIGAGALDLSALTASGGGGTGSGTGGGAASSGWSKAPIDASGLKAADAEVDLTASSIDLGLARLGKTHAVVTVENGRAVVQLKQLSAYGGGVTGEVVANARSGFSTAADLTVSGVSMQPLLTDLAGYKRLIGTGDMRLKLLASGNSLWALTHSLSGSGSVKFGKGELVGLDLVGMLRTLNVNYVGAGKKTIFDSIGGSFTIKQGVLSNNDLAFAAPLLTAKGAGTVNIGGQSLDYTVTPTALTKADGTGGLTVPVKISGPWASPRFGIDAKAIADEKLKVEKKKLEQKAKDELAKKLKVTPEGGQSTEDAVKKKLEDEAKKGLLNLLK